MSLLWTSLDDFGAILEVFGASLDVAELISDVVGASLDVFGATLDVFRSSSDVLGASLDALDVLWGIIGRLWVTVDAIVNITFNKYIFIFLIIIYFKKIIQFFLKE